MNGNAFDENVWTFNKKYYNINKEVSQYEMEIASVQETWGTG